MDSTLLMNYFISNKVFLILFYTEMLINMEIPKLNISVTKSAVNGQVVDISNSDIDITEKEESTNED